MTNKTFCDICEKEVYYLDRIKSYGTLIFGGEYCKECWINKKNWEKIHKLKPSDEE